LDKRLGDSGKGIGSRGPGPFACIEDSKPKGRVIVEHLAHELSADEPTMSFLILQDEDTILAALIETAVANEVEDVDGFLATAKSPLQGSQARGAQPFEDNLALVDEILYGLLEIGSVTGGAQGREVIRPRDHREDPERWLDSEWLDQLRKIRVPDQR
jgi:hypothetical protein